MEVCGLCMEEDTDGNSTKPEKKSMRNVMHTMNVIVIAFSGFNCMFQLNYPIRFFSVEEEVHREKGSVDFESSKIQKVGTLGLSF